MQSEKKQAAVLLLDGFKIQQLIGADIMELRD